VDAAFANCLLPDRGGAVHGDNGRRLDVLHLLFGTLSEERSKRVAWSGRARAIEDPSVAPDEVRVPEPHRTKLRLTPQQIVLMTNPDDSEGTFIALRATAHDEPVLRLPPAAFTRLRFVGDRAASASLHVPLSDAAGREAEGLLRGDPGARRSAAERGWIDGRSRTPCSPGCARGTVGRTDAAGFAADSCGRARGRGHSEDVPLERVERDVRPVPVDPEPPPPRRRRVGISEGPCPAATAVSARALPRVSSAEDSPFVNSSANPPLAERSAPATRVAAG
jgi:hypothetical protein